MKTYKYTDCACKVYGIPFFEEKKIFTRLDEDVIKLCPNLEEFSYHPCGSRIGFKTDSKKITINIKLDNVYVDRGMSYYQANVGNAFIGPHDKSEYLGIITASNSYDENEIYATFDLPDGVNQITVFMPRNPTVKDILLTIDDDANIYEPDEYKISKPMLFYGSSITENGHTSSPNSYPSLLSRWFDADFYNLGFSGSARGEIAIADYIGKIDCSIFFYDYDHNAPDAQELRERHERFFKRIRQYHPSIPIIMSSRPVDYDASGDERSSVIRQTYLNAVASGDKNVFFVDGNDFFPDDIKAVCTTDKTHPNDLGHYMMAKKLEEIINSNALLRK